MAMERAIKIQETLSPQFPSFIKLMRRSHVSTPFFLPLPVSFSNHLPKRDASIVLESEDGKEKETVFRIRKHGFDGGWKEFSLAHNLVEGDVVVFQLIQPIKFKLHLVKVNDLAPNRLAPMTNENNSRKTNTNIEYVSLEDMSEDEHSSSHKTNNNIEYVSSEDMTEYEYSNSFLDFDMFKFVLHESGIYSKLSKQNFIKYYELCCTQKSHLHFGVSGRSSTFIAEIITEAISIADAIRSCDLGTNQENFVKWNKSLEAFEMLGMKVGFLRSRLNRLAGLAFSQQRKTESKRIKEARGEREQVHDEAAALEFKLQEVKETMRRLDNEIKDLEVKHEMDNIMFVEEANAPW